LVSIRGLIKWYHRGYYLNEAIKNGHLHIVKYLVLEVYQNEDDFKPWMIQVAVFHGHLEILKYLISKNGMNKKLTILKEINCPLKMNLN
jgi:hypothetical protein